MVLIHFPSIPVTRCRDSVKSFQIGLVRKSAYRMEVTTLISSTELPGCGIVNYKDPDDRVRDAENN